MQEVKKFSLPIIMVNRFTKIMGTIIKTTSYPFHYIFPNKRFTIPTQSDPIMKSNKTLKVTKIIWQTNYSNKVALPIYINYLWNRLMSLSFEYRYVSTEERLTFIRNHASKEAIEAFEKLTDGAAQADFWRLFVLYKMGGIYIDIDAHLVWPLSKIIKPEDIEVILLNKEHFTNYFIASTKNNPILEKSLNIIIDNIKNKRIDGGVYNMTGPAVLNLAIGNKEVNHRYYKTTCIQGSFTNEYFQYLDKQKGKWTYKKNEDLLKD